jgi:hypothetical protein
VISLFAGPDAAKMPGFSTAGLPWIEYFSESCMGLA